ncbi:hypothetical protein HOE31_02020 [bacterium]|jgi:hypothetical protein|nr:hypothetical protein [bacterium]MBT4121708.1 hypothetical protein [bacterium]MBT4335468.1 hypothetical protein [bacterium]MBT4495950.1 hypothetical protein [bacterium]MBT4764359.1 hypothetical protein [bacterium]
MLEIKKLGILSIAKFSAILMSGVYLVVGVVISIFYFIMGIFVLKTADFISLGSGILANFLLAILVGISSFVIGAIVAWLYNMTVKFVGGIKIEFSDGAKEIKKEQPQEEVNNLIEGVPTGENEDTFSS